MSKILIVLLSLACATARADVEHGEDPPVGATQVPMRREGIDGIWFRADVAQRVLRDLQTAKLTIDLQTLYERKIELLDEEIAASQRLLALAEQGEMRASDALDRAVFARLEVEKQRDAWHRSPALWFGVGAALSALAVAAGAYALSQ